MLCDGPMGKFLREVGLDWVLQMMGEDGKKMLVGISDVVGVGWGDHWSVLADWMAEELCECVSAENSLRV